MATFLPANRTSSTGNFSITGKLGMFRLRMSIQSTYGITSANGPPMPKGTDSALTHFLPSRSQNRCWLFNVLWVLMAFAASDTEAQGIRAGDELWLVSTRCITSNSLAVDLESPKFSVYSYAATHQFLPEDRDTLIADINSETNLTTIVYVHGNRFEADDAVNRGWFVYQQLIAQCPTISSMRFIIWSWPSAPIQGVLKDVRLKACRTNAQGLYLAWFLQQIASSPRPINMIGYSFGGRVITGALHALAGGSLGGNALPGGQITGLPITVGLIAAAVNQDWLRPGSYHGLASLNMRELTLMYNPRDSILKRYWLLEPGSHAEALGAAGVPAVGPSADGTALQIRSHNCSRTVGLQHDEVDYYSHECRAGCIFARMIERSQNEH